MPASFLIDSKSGKISFWTYCHFLFRNKAKILQLCLVEWDKSRGRVRQRPKMELIWIFGSDLLLFDPKRSVKIRLLWLWTALAWIFVLFWPQQQQRSVELFQGSRSAKLIKLEKRTTDGWQTPIKIGSKCQSTNPKTSSLRTPKLPPIIADIDMPFLSST